MNFKKHYTNLTNLGHPFGLSAIKFGRLLVEVGLRNSDGTPAPLSLTKKIAVPTPLNDGTPFWMWHRKLVRRHLYSLGKFPVLLSPAELLVLRIQHDHKRCEKMDDGSKMASLNYDFCYEEWVTAWEALTPQQKDEFNQRARNSNISWFLDNR